MISNMIHNIYIIIAHCGHTSKACSTMINPIQLGDIDITQDVVRVISISPRKCSDKRDEAQTTFFSTNQTRMIHKPVILLAK